MTNVGQNSIWFFEKEESRVNDNTTPAWQGFVLEYMQDIGVQAPMSNMLGGQVKF